MPVDSIVHADGPACSPRRWQVTLVSHPVALPPRPVLVQADSQCDCACYALEGGELPVLASPLSFYLELTPACNNRCAACGNTFAPPGSRQRPAGRQAPLSAADWQQILAKLQPHACRIKLTGGEPTLHPEFETIVQNVADLGLSFTLFTNGRWPRPERLICLLRGLPASQGLLISLHGATAGAHEAFNGTPGSFAETLAAVRLAVDAGIPVSLSCILTRYAWQQVDELVALAHQLGADSVVFNRFLGRDLAGLGAEPEQLRTAVRRIAAQRAAGEPVKLGNCLPACFDGAAETEQAGCLAGLAFFTVDPWGQTRPCNHAPLACGNLLSQSVEQIWRSSSLDMWRSLLAPECRSCTALATCRGGCRAQALLLGREGDPLMAGHLGAPPARTPSRVHFHEAARPVGLFERRQSASGCVLLRGNRLLAVDRQDEPALAMLDGRATLRQIEAACGASGLAFVATLYQHGMIELTN